MGDGFTELSLCGRFINVDSRRSFERMDVDVTGDGGSRKPFCTVGVAVVDDIGLVFLLLQLLLYLYE